MPFISASVISPYNSIRGGAEGGLVPGELLLDLYPNAEIALDFFKLRTDYNGNCIRVRRPSDDAQLDIGFVDNYIDTASLLTFAGAEDVFIVKRYDQSGNGNDTFVDAVDNQPKIVNAGVLVTEGGIAMGDWDGTNDYLATAAGLNFGTSARSIFTVQKADTIAVSTIVNLASNSTPGGAWLVSPEVGVRAVAQGWISSTPISTNNISLLSNIYIGGDIHSGNSMWIDGSSVTRTSGNDGAINTQNAVLSEGAQSSASNAFDGRKGTLIVYKSDQTANRTAIENIINSNYKIYWDGSQNGILDDYPNASAAYSLRALNSAYTGAAIKVRRSSDNEEQDIGLLYDGTLDTSSLLSFVGAGDGFVSKWYDQSGAGNNAAQTSASKQPILVSNGAVNELNGKPTMSFSSPFLMHLNLTEYPFTSGGSATEKSIFAVALNDSTTDQNLYNIADGRDLYALTYNRVGNNTYGFLGANYGVIGGNITGQNIISSFAISPSSETFNNAVEGVSSNPVRGIYDSISIGSRGGGSYSMNGNIQEIVMYESNQSANREAIETNINNHYTIYP